MLFSTNYFFIVLSVIFTFSSYLIYLKSILKGETKPHIISWFIWGLISFIILIIQLYNNAGIGALNIGFVAFLCLLIAFISFKKGSRKINKSDSFSLIFGILSIILWIFSNNPFLSVVLLICVDVFGFIPTILKSLKSSFEENENAYFLAGGGYLMSIFAMNEISFLTIGYVAISCSLNFILAMIIFYKKRSLMPSIV